jgi:hypothetical protein
MKRWFIACFLMLTLVAPWSGVRAQTPLEIERLQVDIWPEFDKPDALIIYRMTIAANSTLPAQVSLRIPKEVGAPFNVAMKDVDGMLYNLKYDQVVDGNWLRISFTAAAAEIQLEYYDPSVVRTGNNRQISFTWAGDYRVRNMFFRIQQPVNATDMQVTKSSLKIDNGAVLDDGLTYYTVPIDGVVEAGATFGVQFSYNKPDSILTSSQAPVQPVRTVTGGAPLTNGLPETNSVMFLGLGIGGALILVGLVWYFNQRRVAVAGSAGSSRRRHVSTPAPMRTRVRTSAAEETASSEATYCHQCGKRAGPGDTFCRACGTKLRE